MALQTTQATLTGESSLVAKRRGRPPKLRLPTPHEEKIGLEKVEEAVANTVAALDPIKSFIDRMSKLKKAENDRFYKK